MDESPAHLLFHIVARDDLDPLARVPGAITVDRLRDRLGSALRGERAVELSFDDAHPSVLEHGLPLLRSMGLSAHVFAATGHVGQTKHSLGWDGLRRLAAAGWDVGSHHERHERMGWRQYDEDDAAWRARLTAAARRSRETLERELRAPVGSFAYPFGEAPAGAREAVATAGFERAYTVALDFGWGGDPMGIPRVDGLPGEAPADDTPGISVIVPACDRLPTLREVVRRWSLQSYPADRWEVIVGDDGSTADLAAELAPWLGPNVRVERLPGSGSTFRAGQARQHGAERARFDVLAFLDADVAVDQDFLWHLSWTHARDPRAVVLGYLSGYNLTDLGHRHEAADIAPTERLTGDVVPVIPDRSREPALAACFDNVALLDEPWGLAYTGNLSVRRSLLAEAGGFATDFEGWGFEDVDLGVRLHGAGARWTFSRFALSYHLAEPDEGPTSNPFRDPAPTPDKFAGVLRNLATLESRHPGHGGVQRFVASVRSDIDEICSRPWTVGVRVDGPGGFSTWQILDRIAYARRVGAKELYVLGPGVAARDDVEVWVAAARGAGLAVALEVDAESLDAGHADALRRLGISLRPA